MHGTGFWWVILSLALYGVLHSLLASLRWKAWVRRRIGETRFDRFYRLFFNFMAAVTLLPSLALTALLPDETIYTVRFPWLVLTALVQFLALLGLAAGVMQTGGANFLGLEQLFQPEKAVQPRRFVSGGLYRWVRHPLYFFSLLILWLFPVMSWNILAFNIGATLYLTIGSWFEERKLLREFGEQYAAYRRCTPMLFPLFRRKPCVGEEAGGE